MPELITAAVKNLHVIDVLCFSTVLAVSLGIGLYHAFTGGKQKTTAEYYMANHKLRTVPVALSILVSFVSAILVLGTPAEMYTRGTQLVMRVIGYCVTCVVSSVLFVPLLYPLKITSSFEYLELRYKSKAVKLMGSFMMLLGNVFYMGLLLYTPSTALQAVTPFPFWCSVIVTGCVSTIYTTLGGMKAVIWTDVFQASVMIVGMLVIVVQGTLMVGGVSKVLKVSQDGGRLIFFNFDLDPTQRLNIWSLVVGGLFSSINIFGIGQQSVQRYSALPTLKQAQRSIYLNIPGLIVVNVLAALVGLVVYAHYAINKCDPLKARYIRNPNQIVPYFIIDVLNYPGVLGLFLSVLFSGALSSMSSCLNGAAAVTWQDMCKPLLLHWPEKRQMMVNKALVLFYGACAMVVAFLADGIGGHVLQASLSFTGATMGPSLGMFVLGAFFRVGNSYGAVSGCLIATAVNLWLAIGTFIRKPYSRTTLPTSVENCAINTSLHSYVLTRLTDIAQQSRDDAYVMASNNHTYQEIVFDSYLAPAQQLANFSDSAVTQALTPSYDVSTVHAHDVTVRSDAVAAASSLEGVDKVYAISFLWYSFIGCVVSVTIGLIVSIITGKYSGQRHDVADSLMIPLRRRLCQMVPSFFRRNRHRRFSPADVTTHAGREHTIAQNGKEAEIKKLSESEIPLKQYSV